MKIIVIVFFWCAFLSGCVSTTDLRQGDLLHNQGKIIEALQYYQKALAGMGGSGSERESLEKKIAELKYSIAADFLKKSEVAYAPQPTVPGVKHAIRILEESLLYDDNQQSMTKRVGQYKIILSELQAKHSDLQNDAVKALTEEQWTQAFQLYNAAYIINPEDKIVLNKRNEILPQRNFYYKDKITKAIASEDWRDADAKLAAFKAELPSPDPKVSEELAVMVKDLKDKLVAIEVKDLMNQKKYYRAYDLIVKENIRSLDPQLDIIKKQGSWYYLSKIKEEQASLSPKESFAYLSAVKALKLDPQNSEIFALHRNFQDKLDEWITVNIAISGFSSPHNNLGIGDQFSDNLIAYLVAKLPYGIEVLERSKIDLMLRESGQELKELSKKLGSKMFVIGNVSTLEIEHQRSERESTVVVPVGTRQEPNPLYNQMISTYGPNTSKWPQVPPMTISTSITEMVKYKMGHERMKGLMNVSVRIFDAEKGAITVAETFKATDDISDQFQDAVPAAEIQYDPLELPTDNEIQEKLIGELVSKVADVVLKAFEQREWRFWARANARLDRHEVGLALDELAKGYLYCEQAGIAQDNQYCQEMKQAALFDLTE